MECLDSFFRVEVNSNGRKIVVNGTGEINSSGIKKRGTGQGLKGNSSGRNSVVEGKGKVNSSGRKKHGRV